MTSKWRLSYRLSEDVAADEFVINGNYIIGNEAFRRPPDGSIYSSEIFSNGSVSDWPFVYTATQITDGQSSQNPQTFVINITELPELGANYRIYKTTLNGSDYFSPAM